MRKSTFEHEVETNPDFLRNSLLLRLAAPVI